MKVVLGTFSKQQQSLMREPMQSNEFNSQGTYCIFTSVFYFRTTLIKILVLCFVSLIILGAFKQFFIIKCPFFLVNCFL